MNRSSLSEGSPIIALSRSISALNASSLGGGGCSKDDCDDIEAGDNDGAEDDASCSTGLLTAESKRSRYSNITPPEPAVAQEQSPARTAAAADDEGSTSSRLSLSISNQSKPAPTSEIAPEPAGAQEAQARPPAPVAQDREGETAEEERHELVLQLAAWAVFVGGALLVCSSLGHTRAMSYYLLCCSGWLCLTGGLVAVSCYDTEAWLSANPSKRMSLGWLLVAISACQMAQRPYVNWADLFTAVLLPFHGRVERNFPNLRQPSASKIIVLWLALFQLAEGLRFIWIARDVGTHAQTFELTPGFDSQLAWIRGLTMWALVVLRSVWFEKGGVSPTLKLVYSFYCFVATLSICNVIVGSYLASVGNFYDSAWLFYVAICQTTPILFIVVGVGRKGLYKYFAALEQKIHSFDQSNNARVPRGATTMQVPRWGVGKVLLGIVMACAFVMYNATLEASCATNDDSNEGAGELVITLGGSAGTTFSAPLYTNAGQAKLSANGTGSAELLWVENLCDEVLDCSSCPFVLGPGFNISRLRGKILLYNVKSSEILFMCGLNRIGRAFGATGLIGMGDAAVSSEQYIASSFTVPGHAPKRYRRGEFRDGEPRNGDAGIPFPHFQINQKAFSEFLRDSGVIHNRNHGIQAALAPSAPNPWRSMACGYWKPVVNLLMLGHVLVIEQSISNLFGHFRTSGLRLDLAQLALATESTAHFLMALVHHDPYLAFHWAALPFGAVTAFMLGPIVLTCSSMLLLAAFW